MAPGVPQPLTGARLAAAKRQVIRKIRDAVAPKLRDSGFVEGRLGATHTLRLCALPARPRAQARSNRGDWTAEAWGRPVAGYRDFEYVYGFTADGVITDAHTACVVTYYRGLCLEDLLRLERYVRRVAHLLE